METVELLLTDEFVKFSGKIQQIHSTKMAKTKEFKVVHEAWKKEMAELDEQAKEAQEEWEDWKTEHGSKGEKK